MPKTGRYEADRGPKRGGEGPISASSAPYRGQKEAVLREKGGRSFPAGVKEGGEGPLLGQWSPYLDPKPAFWRSEVLTGDIPEGKRRGLPHYLP